MESRGSIERNRWFVTTRWSLILRVGEDSPESAQALEQLCRLYWYPLFTFARSIGNSREEAEDLTQGFFNQLLERRSLQTISRVGGKFRSFMLVAFKNHAASQSARQRAQKRGGGIPHLALEEPECAALIDESLRNGLSPDRLFDRAWALVVIDRVQASLRADYVNADRLNVYQKLVQFLPGEATSETQIEAAKALGIRDGTFRMELRRFKKHFAERIRAEVADTVGPEGDTDQEVRNLMTAFAE